MKPTSSITSVTARHGVSCSPRRPAHPRRLRTWNSRWRSAAVDHSGSCAHCVRNQSGAARNPLRGRGPVADPCRTSGSRGDAVPNGATRDRRTLQRGVLRRTGERSRARCGGQRGTAVNRVGATARQPRLEHASPLHGTRTGQILNLASSQSTEVDRSWDAVKAAASASDVTKAALSDLTRRFQEVAAAHERLARLTELARHLRTVRRDFAPVARIVAAADGLGPRLQLQDLDRDWHALTDNGLAAIKALAAANPDVVSPRWYRSAARGSEDRR